MPDAIEESLSFDISQGLTGIGQLDDALTQVVQTFQVGLADALSTLTGVGADVTPLAESLDVAGLGPAVDTAITDATSNPFGLTLDADTAPVVDAIDQATSVVPVVTVDGDVTQAQDAIGGLADNPIEIPVDADTSQAQDAISALGDSASGASGSSAGGGSGIAGLAESSLALNAATGLAEGNVSGLTGAVSTLTPELAGAVGAGVGFVGFLSKTITLAADAEAQQKRFNSTFGASAAIVNNIDVGGLKISLEELGKTSGTTNADLEASATRIGLIGAAAGASQPEVAKTTGDILGLAGALAVSNPRFGDAAAVADTLSRALSTGRTRSLIPYGIALTQGQIQQEAFNETGKTSVDQLTAYDKILAGTTLALRQQGDTLGGKYADGAANAAIQFRALRTQVEETLITVGKPLLQPAVQILTAATPAAQEFALALGEVARADIPLVQELIPALQSMATAMHLVVEAEHLVTVSNSGFSAGLSALVTTLGGPAVSGFKAVSGVLGLFHHDSQQATDDLANLSTQLQTVSGVDSLGKLGPAVDDLAKHFSEGSTQAKSFNNSLISLAASGGVDQAEKAVGAITVELEKQGKSAADIGRILRPYFEALDLIAAKNKVAASAVQEAGVTAAASAGGYIQLANAITAGKVSADDASAVATQLGISTADATSFINAQTTALTAAKDKQIEASAAAQTLRSELQLGTITTGQAQAGFANLGISIGGIGTFVTDATTEVSSLISTIESGLPKATDAFKGLTDASAPTQLATNIQQQATQIAAFVAQLEALRNQGHEALATFFASQGVGALTQAAQAAGDSAVAATDAAALRQRQAAVAAADRLGVELAAGGTAAGGKAGKATADAFGSKADIKAAATQEFAKAAALIPGLSNTPNAAALLGVQSGEAFAQGLANGLSNGTQVSAVAAAAGALAGTADAAVRRRLGIKSPSQVAAALGVEFSKGLALGIVDASPQAATASAVLAASVVQQLKDTLAAATAGSSTTVQTAAQSAFTSFLSTASGSLTSVGSDISSFSSTLTSALATQTQDLTAVHKAYQTYAADQEKVKKLTQETAAAFVEFARTGTAAAGTAFRRLAAELTAAKNQLTQDLGQISGAAKTLGDANRAVTAATDPAAFTKNLREQNAQANQFAKDIAKLAKDGFTDLAKQLADAGPEAAGALARGFAKSPAKAKSAEAAVDAANTFAVNYQKELTSLFGPQGGAAQAASTAGLTIGQALTTGFSTSTQAGTAAALGNLSAQIAAGIPAVLPLVQAAVPQKAIPPVAANAPTVIQTPSLAGFAGTQTLELNLTITTLDGQTLKAQTVLPVVSKGGRTLLSQTVAAVHAS